MPIIIQYEVRYRHRICSNIGTFSVWEGATFWYLLFRRKICLFDYFFGSSVSFYVTFDIIWVSNDFLCATSSFVGFLTSVTKIPEVYSLSFALPKAPTYTPVPALSPVLVYPTDPAYPPGVRRSPALIRPTVPAYSTVAI